MRLDELFDRLFCVSFAFYCGVVSVGCLNSTPGKISAALTIFFVVAKWTYRYVNSKNKR